jgi:hypothetical protein
VESYCKGGSVKGFADAHNSFEYLKKKISADAGPLVMGVGDR